MHASMNASDVIEIYIGDTVRDLPSGDRADVAAELRSLLQDELAVQAKTTGQPATTEMAIALVRAYGRPNEVAARYRQPWTIIAPADSRNFVRAVLIGIGTLMLYGSVFDHPRWAFRGESIKDGILAWLGIVVVFFGAKSWLCQRWPAIWPWKPRDRDRSSRFAVAVLLPIASMVAVCYAAPAAVHGPPQLDRYQKMIRDAGRVELNPHDPGRYYITPNSNLSHLVIPDGVFYTYRLPAFFSLVIALILLAGFVALRGRWQRLTFRLSLVLHIACLYILLSIAGDISWLKPRQIQYPEIKFFHLITQVYVLVLAFSIYNEIGRINPIRAIQVKFPLTAPRGADPAPGMA